MKMLRTRPRLARRHAQLLLLSIAAGTGAVAACTSNTNPGAPGVADFDAGPGQDSALPTGNDAGSGAVDASHDATVDSPATVQDGAGGGGEDVTTPDASDASDAAVADAADSATEVDAADANVAFVYPLVLESPGNTPGSAANAQCGLAAQTPSAPSVSQDGRYAAFWTTATNVLPNRTLTSGPYRYFVRDTVNGTTEDVGAMPDGGEYNEVFGFAVQSAISGDGRYVVFQVQANEVDPTLPNSGAFLVRDRTAGTVTYLGATDAGTIYGGQSPVLSADGRYLAFLGSSGIEALPGSPGAQQAWVRDLQGGVDAVTLASVAGTSLADGGGVASSSSVGVGNQMDSVSMSSDGTVVAFDSSSGNLQGGAIDAGVGQFRHCFARNLTTQTTVMLDVQMNGATPSFPNGECDDPVISGNGRYVVFFSDATNLVPGDTNGEGDLFVRDLQLGTTTRVTVDSTGAQIAVANVIPVLYPDYGISSDGAYVVMGDRSHLMAANESSNANRVVIVRDMVHGTNTIASYNSDGTLVQSPQDTWTPAISSDGTFIVFLGTNGNFFPTFSSGQEQVIGVARSAAH